MIKTRKDSRIELLTAAEIFVKQDQKLNSIDILQLERADGGYFMVEYLEAPEEENRSGREWMRRAGYIEGVLIDEDDGDLVGLRTFTGVMGWGQIRIDVFRDLQADMESNALNVSFTQEDEDGKTIGTWEMNAFALEALGHVLAEVRAQQEAEEAAEDA